MKVKNIYEKIEYGPAPESAAPALDWLAQHNKQFNLFMDGGWHKPGGGKYFNSINPSNKSKLFCV
jgi:aldehyde dehydrogenase (NAD+)